MFRHVVLEGLYVQDRDAQQLASVTRQGEATEFDKGHDIATLGAARVLGGAPVDPGPENGGD